MKRRLNDQRGMLLLVFIITLPFLILIVTYYLHLSLTSFQVARLDELHTQAQLAADAGADYGIEQINLDNDWTGTSGEVPLHTDSSVKTTYQVGIASSSATDITMEVTGRTYWPADSTTATRSVTVYVDLRPVSNGNFSVVSGAGGLIMSNSAKIVAGSVLINGTISMANSSQIGLSSSPVTVNVADQACPSPPDATYPQVCTNPSTQPITISGNAHIYGTVKATNQTDSGSMSNPGLVSGSPTPQALPTHDRAAQEAAVSTTMTGAAASCSGKQSITWPANVKITGNVTLANSCKITVLGDAWITGDLTASNTAQLVVSDLLGATRPYLMIDGSSGASFDDASSLTPNSSGTGFEVITFWSAASCSPECPSVTGSDLYDSQHHTTITLNNNVSASETILYAYWSQVSISNAGEIGAVLGQTVSISNNAAITFGSTAGISNTIWVESGYRKG